jgi:hypothetical protein
MSRLSHSKLWDAAVLVSYFVALLALGHAVNLQSNDAFSMLMFIPSIAAGAALGRFTWLYLALFVEWAAAVWIVSDWQVLAPDQSEGLVVLLIIPPLWALVVASYGLGAGTRLWIAKRVHGSVSV